MIDPTIQKHLNNIMFAIDNSTMKGKEFREVLKSYIHIESLLIKKEEPKIKN